MSRSPRFATVFAAGLALAVYLGGGSGHYETAAAEQACLAWRQAVLPRGEAASPAAERLRELPLLEAALAAGGVDDRPTLARCRQRLDDFRHQAAPLVESIQAPSEQAEALLAAMHDRLLKGGYERHCNRLDQTLDEGRYNCVTATILYCLLAEDFHLPVAAVAEPAHVRSRLLAAQPLEVETTCRDGFSPRAGLSRGRLLAPAELVAKVSYNRGTALIEARRFDEAAALLATALALDPADAVARDNLAAALNNQALAECAAQRFERAAALLEKAHGVRPDYAPLAANDVYVHQQWALRLCAEGQYGRAWELLEAAHRRRPEVELFDRGRSAVLAAWQDALDGSRLGPLAPGDGDAQRPSGFSRACGDLTCPVP